MKRKNNLFNVILWIAVVAILAGLVWYGRMTLREVESPVDSMEAPLPEIALGNDAKGRTVFVQFQKMLEEKRPTGELYDFIEKNHLLLDEKSRDYCILEAFGRVPKNLEKLVKGLETWDTSGFYIGLPGYEGNRDPETTKLLNAIGNEFKNNFKEEHKHMDNLAGKIAQDPQLRARIKDTVVKDFFEALIRYGYSDLVSDKKGDELESTQSPQVSLTINVDYERPRKFTSKMVSDYLDLRKELDAFGPALELSMQAEKINKLNAFLQKNPGFVKQNEVKSRLNEEMAKFFTTLCGFADFDFRTMAGSKLNGKPEVVENVNTSFAEMEKFKNTYIGNITEEYFSIIHQFHKKNGHYVYPLLMDQMEPFFDKYLPELDLYGKKSIEILKKKNMVNEGDLLVLSGWRLPSIEVRSGETFSHENEISAYQNGTLKRIFRVNNKREQAMEKASNFLNAEQKRKVLEELRDVRWVDKRWLDEVTASKTFKKDALGGAYVVIEYREGKWYFSTGNLIHGGIVKTDEIYEIGYGSSGTMVIFTRLNSGEIWKNAKGNLVARGEVYGNGDGRYPVIMMSEPFEYVENKDPNAYLVDRLLGGNYISETGQKYSFDKNAMADFNGKKFKIHLAMGRSDTSEYDTFSTDVGKFYAFRIEGGKLKLYEANLMQEKLEISEKPLVVLTKLNG